MDKRVFKLGAAVCALVTAAFTNIYITQPILPVLEAEFGVSIVQVSFTVSFVILGIVISNLPFGWLSDRIAIHPILMGGGTAVAAGGLICAVTHNFYVLVGARLLQGLFLPALTTSLAAWLAKNLPKEKLSVVMGTYVAATVLGGLGGRLLGGFIHPPLHWRYAFVSAAVLIVISTIFAVIVLPRPEKTCREKSADGGAELSCEEEKGGMEFRALLFRKDLFPLYCCGATGLLMFSPIFNYLPYRLTGAPFEFSTEMITLVYLVYVLGIFIGPLAGQFSQRVGQGRTMMLGALVLGAAFGMLLIPTVWAVILGLLTTCAGFFTIHATAVGLLNQKLTRGQGQANALYVLFYYIGGWMGITAAGFAHEALGWKGVVFTVALFLVIPFFTGLMEHRAGKRA